MNFFFFVSCIIHHSTLCCIVTNMVVNTTMPSSGSMLKNFWYSMATNITKQYKVCMSNVNEPISIVKSVQEISRNTCYSTVANCVVIFVSFSRLYTYTYIYNIVFLQNCWKFCWVNPHLYGMLLNVSINAKSWSGCCCVCCYVYRLVLCYTYSNDV
jgi:hypothetical protein